MLWPCSKRQKEIRFVLEREEISSVFGKLLAKGEIPLRVTHNDTKLNNIMIDYATGKGLCVIDLDTIMPGLAMNDLAILFALVRVQQQRMKKI